MPAPLSANDARLFKLLHKLVMLQLAHP